MTLFPTGGHVPIKGNRYTISGGNEECAMVPEDS